MLGGVTSYFEREDRDVLAQFIDAGYAYADSYNRLASIPTGSNVIGLFAPVALPKVLDDKRKNRLEYLTQHAIKHLENDNGFFLLVEASQVDGAGHANDIGSAMAEMHDLAQTLNYLRTYVEENPDTLVILTADHSTGGLTIGANGDYLWFPEYLRNLKASAETMAKALGEQEDVGQYMAQTLGFELNSEELAHFANVASLDEEARYAAIKAFLDSKTNTGWTSSGHTGVDVEVFAFGAGKQAFTCQIDNTDIAKKIFRFIDNRPHNGDSVDINVELNDGSAGSNDCDFKDDWRCQ
jgi:alkaline phosphatase